MSNMFYYEDLEKRYKDITFSAVKETQWAVSLQTLGQGAECSELHCV